MANNNNVKLKKKHAKLLTDRHDSNVAIMGEEI